MIGEFERDARAKRIADFARWQRGYYAMESNKVDANEFDADEVRDADQFAQALERPTLAMLDTVEQLVRATVIDMMYRDTDAQGLTSHDRKMFSSLKVKY
jgi:hypothetical protein